MNQRKVIWGAALLGVGVLGDLGILACSSSSAAGPETPDAAEAAPTPEPEAAVGPAPYIQVLNNLVSFPPADNARLCLTAGATLLTEASIAVEKYAPTPLALTPEFGAKLVTEAITVHMLPFNVVKPCAEAIASTDYGVVKLPEYPAGTFAGDHSYLLILQGCVQADGVTCSQQEDGGVTAGASTLRGTVTELDIAPVDPTAIGFQFINGSLTLAPDETVIPVQAMALGGWNDGPKAIGTPIAFASQPLITPAKTAQIPAVGFLPPSTGGVRLHQTDSAGSKIAEVIASQLSSVTFTAGKNYVVVNAGKQFAYKIVVFPATK
ncbi:hypothetical protein [Labilithrix luteola]|nr:hypothetical protein [Labilithrix luteola]